MIKIFFLLVISSFYVSQTAAFSQIVSPSPIPNTINPFSTCGNGILEAGEQCDDRNNINGDGCSASCTFEGRPPDALAPVSTPTTATPAPILAPAIPAASPAPIAASPTQQNCSCTDSTGTFPWNCTISVPPETRPCFDVCVEQANQNFGSYSSYNANYNSFEN